MDFTRPRRLVTLLAAACAVACDNPLDSLAPPRILGLTVAETEHPLVRVATVELDRPGPVTLTWSAPGTPTLTLNTDEQTVVLPRLRERRTYTLEATSTRPARTGAARQTTFTTGALPDDVAALKFTATGTPTHDVAMVEIVTSTTGFLGAVLIEDGEVVWYHRTNGSLFGTTRRENGELVLLDPSLGLVAVQLDGTIVHRLPQADAGTAYGRIHHDAIATPHNAILFIANELRTLNDTTVWGEALWEWSPESGRVQKRWSAFEHLNWATERGPRSDPANWLHGNGLAYGPRGNVLLSMRNMDQVLSIAPDFSRVEWRLGGPGATLAVADGDLFLGQHGVSEPAAGRLLVFDNGFERPGTRYSRAVEYAIDANGRTATRVWQFRPSPDIYASLVGSARRLANGHTVVLFGMSPGHLASSGPIVALEVDAGGAERWRLTATAGATRLYRVTPLASLIGEVRR